MSYQAGGPSHPPTMSEHGMADQAGSMLFVVAILSALLAEYAEDVIVAAALGLLEETAVGAPEPAHGVEFSSMAK